MKTQVDFFQGASNQVKNGVNLIIPFVIDCQSQAIIVHEDHAWIRKTNVWKAFCEQDPHKMKEGEMYIKSLDTLTTDFINIVLIKSTGRSVKELLHNVLAFFTMHHIEHMQIPAFWVGYLQDMKETMQQIIDASIQFGSTLRTVNHEIAVTIAVPKNAYTDDVLQVLRENGLLERTHWNADKNIMD